MPNVKLKDIEAAIIQTLQDAVSLESVLDRNIRSLGDSIPVGLETFLRSNVAQFPMLLVVYGGDDTMTHDFKMVEFQEKQTWAIIVADRSLNSEEDSRIGSDAQQVAGTYNLKESVRDILHRSNLGLAPDVHEMLYRNTVAITNELQVSAYALNFELIVELIATNP